MKITSRICFFIETLRGHVLYYPTVEHSHVSICDVSFNFKPTAVAPKCLLVLGAIKLLYLGLFKCFTGFLHLGHR